MNFYQYYGTGGGGGGGGTVDQTASWVVTSTFANKVWITGTVHVDNPGGGGGGGGTVDQTASWVVTDAGSGLSVNAAQAGTWNIGTLASITNVVNVSARQTASWVVSDGGAGITVDGLVGVTGAIAVTSGVITTITNPVTVTASLTNPVSVVVSGDLVAVFSGVQSVTSTLANPVYVTGTVASTPGGVQTVTSTFGNPVYVTSTLASPINIVGSITSTPQFAGNGGFSAAAVSGTTTLVLASNANRRGATIYNPTTATINIAYGFAATLTNFSVRLPQSSLIEVPFNYTGTINGVALSAGPYTINVTEFVA
jgi:hypothetical protein